METQITAYVVDDVILKKMLQQEEATKWQKYCDHMASPELWADVTKVLVLTGATTAATYAVNAAFNRLMS